VANKQQYADRHGYDVIVDGDVIDETRPTSWSKLLAMRKYLPYYDYLFYVDADTLVTNPELKLEDIVDYGYDQILAADRNGLNCGVWLIRNTPWSLWFLDEMWAQTQLVNPQTFVLFHYEQRAMHYLYQSKVWTASVKQPAYQQANTVRARTKVINACVFNSYPAWYRKDDFIVHLAGLKGIAKCLTFRHYYQKAQQKFALSGTSLGSVGEETDVPAPSWGTCFFGRI
jgi:glycosyltransferase involved in cell wall biosynthesis